MNGVGDNGPPGTGVGRSFRARLVFSFGAVLALVLGVTLLIQLFGVPSTGHVGIYRQTMDENSRTLSLAADMSKDLLMNWFNERKGDALVLAESSAMGTETIRLRRLMKASGKKGGVDPAALRKLPEYAESEQKMLLRMTAYSAYESIKIADAATGKIMVSTRPGEVGLPVSYGALITGPVETGEPRLEMIQDADKKYWIYLAYPIRAGQGGKPVAVAILKARAEEAIAPVLGIAHRLGEGAEVIFADKGLTIFAAMSAGKAGAKPVTHAIAQAPPTTPVGLAVMGEEGATVTNDYRGVEVLAAYRHIPISRQEKWGLAIKRKTADIHSATTRMVAYTIGLYFTLAALFLLAAFGMAKNLSRPIETLARLARRAGTGEAGVRSPAFDGEAGILAENFNAMLGNIEENTRKLNDEIEERKRTETHLRESEEALRAAMEELRRKTGQLERSNKELEQFAYVSSHDLQEPLRTITSYVRLLEKRYKSRLDDNANVYIDFVTDAARRMQNLINDLLNFSRIGSRAKPFGPVRTEDVVESVMASLKMHNPGAAITRDGLPDIVGDEMQIMQVFQNLIGNAVKFHGATPPTVHIGAMEDDEQWTFWVKDKGIGIDPGHFERIFVIFQRLHTRTEYDGTGIGLALVKKVVERHGGRIWVESEPGKGSTFFFTISKKPQFDGGDPP